MDETGIKDERLQRLMKAARNARGTIEADMLEALEKATTEYEFEIKWYRKIRNELKQNLQLLQRACRKAWRREDTYLYLR